jgi:hypothetical protein
LEKPNSSDETTWDDMRQLWTRLTPTQRRAARTILQHLPDLKPDVLKRVTGTVLLPAGKKA